jgi:hypothetical protein
LESLHFLSSLLRCSFSGYLFGNSILLLRPLLKYYSIKEASLTTFLTLLGIEPRASHMLGKLSGTDYIPNPLITPS